MQQTKNFQILPQNYFQNCLKSHKQSNKSNKIYHTQQELNKINLLNNYLCCICGLDNCQSQSYDHQKITLKQLQELIYDNSINFCQIKELKQKVKNFYSEIKKTVNKQIKKQQIEIRKYLNKFFFTDKLTNKVDIGLLSDIIEKDLDKLPNKKICNMVKKLKNQKNLNNNLRSFGKDNNKVINRCSTKTSLTKSVQLQIQETQNQSIFTFTNNLFSSFDLKSFQTNFSQNLSSLNIKNLYRQKRPITLKPKTSISQLTNPQQYQLFDLNKIYQWRNVRITKNSRIVPFSNKNISDRQVMQQIQILSNYKNLQQFQIRNNKISSLTCNIIANNMDFLISVDIRGNKIDDKGIIKLIHGIPHMKNFYISQTQATDQSGKQIVQKLNNLQILWSQHTRLSNQIALKIAQKPKLKVLSLIGNPIDDQYKQKMRKIYISKGYISI